VTTPSAGAKQAQVAALLLCAGAFCVEACEVLARAGQRRFGGGKLGRRGIHLLHLAFGHAGTDEALAPQVLIAARIGGGHFAPGGAVGQLCRGRVDRILRPPGGRVRCGDALIKVDRVHLRQQLAGFHYIPDIHGDVAHAPGRGGADQIAAPRFDDADAEQQRRQVGPRDRRDSDAHRRQRPAARDEQHQYGHQHDSGSAIRKVRRSKEQVSSRAASCRSRIHGALRDDLPFRRSENIERSDIAATERSFMLTAGDHAQRKGHASSALRSDFMRCS
jgi:hypothetical protein